MHLPVLGAALQRRYDLARVEPAGGVEGALERVHLLALLDAELHAHRAQLLDTDAVLSGDGAAERDAGFQDLGAEELAAVQLVGVVGVEEDQRVQVAVAGVEDVAAAQCVLLLHLGNRQQDVGQALARNRAVHAHVVGADAPRCREGVLAPAPELQALRLVLAHFHARGAGARQHVEHAVDLLGHLFGRAVAFAQQDGRGREVVAGVHEVFDGRRHRLVHHLQPGRDDAGGDHRGHRVAGLADVVEAGHDAARELRLGHQLDSHFQDHREHAFAAHDQRQQVQTRRVQRLGAETHRLALHRQAAHAQHVVQRQAVLQAMHAAGVFGHVAANGAGDLARRIGCVVQAEGRRRLADGQVAHAALHGGGARGAVDLHDLVELAQRQRDAHRVRQRAAAQARAGAARHHRQAEFMAGAQHRGDLRFGFRQRHQQRQLAVGGEAVAFVGHGVLALPEQRVRRQQRRQRGHRLRLAPGAVGCSIGRGLGNCRGQRCIHRQIPGGVERGPSNGNCSGGASPTGDIRRGARSKRFRRRRGLSAAFMRGR